ncbi:hypothetical protein L0Y65_04620 [Candidatus Micrarchaeota archaeon]|nr:hypothetical protein [Candidatus Micrarchaeota archaeon]
MAGSKLNNLTDRQKKAMGYVVSAWKKSGETFATLEEGLRVLSSDKRPTANAISTSEESYMAVACGYGKGYRNKLTLSKEDAALLLELVVPIRREACCEESAKKMVELAAGVLLDGRAVPKTITDPSWERVLRVLAEVAPSAGQSRMF